MKHETESCVRAQWNVGLYMANGIIVDVSVQNDAPDKRLLIGIYPCEPPSAMLSAREE